MFLQITKLLFKRSLKKVYYAPKHIFEKPPEKVKLNGFYQVVNTLFKNVKAQQIFTDTFFSIKSQEKMTKQPYSYIKRKPHYFSINTFIYVIVWILQSKNNSSITNPVLFKEKRKHWQDQRFPSNHGQDEKESEIKHLRIF